MWLLLSDDGRRCDVCHVYVVTGQGLDVPEVPASAPNTAYAPAPSASSPWAAPASPVASQSATEPEAAFGQENMGGMFSDEGQAAIQASAVASSVSSLFDDGAQESNSNSLFDTPAPALTGDELHMQRLREFFAENRPDNVPRVPELYSKLGKQIWAAMEAKYPGKTAKYTVVS